jgi:hypothetical protein
VDRQNFQVTAIALHIGDVVGRSKVHQWVKNAYDDGESSTTSEISEQPRWKTEAAT